ncbi:MAG TPA: SDR family NAD(P)-dependent oxidoreductase, partial [Nevskiaceae bacterium]|nr:SDR family NAD(P)-dependent oxidoreductase [Nevskiaceae bacterium]
MAGEALQFSGGVAVITGAASGIGAGLARQAQARGMRVVIADITPAPLQALAGSLPGEVLPVVTDVTDPASVEQLAQTTYARFGQVDLLFNNAGIMVTGNTWEIDLKRWKRVMEVNVYGILHGIHSFVPRLLKADRPARIVNTASIGGFFPSPLMSPYSASKFAAVALTESLCCELQLLKAPVALSLLAPGPVKTGIFNDPFGGKADAATKAFVANMLSMTDQFGLTPDQFAVRVFEGIEAG